MNPRAAVSVIDVITDNRKVTGQVQPANIPKGCAPRLGNHYDYLPTYGSEMPVCPLDLSRGRDPNCKFATCEIYNKLRPGL